LSHLRAQLEQQRRFRLDQLAGLRDGDEPHNEIAETLATAARAALRDVTEALRRMDDGSYGTCADCGRALALERLEVLPQVGRCAGCLESAQA
jgi:DnaK suppressor protein